MPSASSVSLPNRPSSTATTPTASLMGTASISHFVHQQCLTTKSTVVTNSGCHCNCCHCLNLTLMGTVNQPMHLTEATQLFATYSTKWIWLTTRTHSPCMLELGLLDVVRTNLQCQVTTLWTHFAIWPKLRLLVNCNNIRANLSHLCIARLIFRLKLFYGSLYLQVSLDDNSIISNALTLLSFSLCSCRVNRESGTCRHLLHETMCYCKCYIYSNVASAITWHTIEYLAVIQAIAAHKWQFLYLQST